MSTKQGYIKDFEDNKMLPETTTVMVTDVARSQALSASLLALVEKNALGYPDFTTTVEHPVGQEVFYDRKLWKFTAELAEGADWDATKVREFSIKEYMDAIETRVTNVENNYARKDGFYEDLTAGNAVNILAEGLITEQAALGVTAPEDEVGDGMSAIQEIHGDGVAWNQIYKTEGLATETAQLNDLTTRVVERFTTNAGTTPMGAFFVREKLTNHEFAEVPTTKTGEGFFPTVTEDNKDGYTGIHYFVRATHTDVVTKAENADATSAFFISGSSERQVMDMAVMFGIDIGTNGYTLPTTSPSTWGQMMAWLGQKVGIAEAYDFCAGKLIGVTQLALTSMPGTNLLNPAAGVAICPYYAWGDNSGLYRIQAPSGTTISSVVSEALSGQAVEVVAVTAGSVYEVTVPEGDACVITVSVSAGSLASCAVWQVWDDTTVFSDIAAYSHDSLFLSVGRIYGKLNVDGSLEKCFADGTAKGTPHATDIINIAIGIVNVKNAAIDLGNLSWTKQIYGDRTDYYQSSDVTDKKTGSYSSKDMLCAKYVSSQWTIVFSSSFNKSIFSSAAQKVLLTDFSHSDAPSVSDNWLSGVITWYPLATPKSYTTLHYDISASGDGSELVPLAEAFNHNIRIGNMGVNLDTTNWNASTNRFSADPVGVAPETVSQMPSNIVEQVDTNRQFNENLRTSLPTALAAAGVTGITIDVDGTASYSA